MKFSLSVFVAFAACFSVCLAYEHKQSHDDKFEKPYDNVLKSWFNLTPEQWRQKCSVEGKYEMTDIKNLIKLSIKIGRDLSDDLASKGAGESKKNFDIYYNYLCLSSIVLTDLKVYGAIKLQLCLSEKERLSEANTVKLAREIQEGFCAAVKEVAIEKLQGEQEKKNSVPKP